MSWLPAELLIIFGAALVVVAALHDIVARTIPNWIAMALAVAGLALRILNHSLPTGLIAAALIFLLTAFCWRRGWMGGGDVKLLAAAALAIPPGAALGFVTAVSLAGSVLALLYLVAGRVLRARMATMAPRPAGLVRRALRAERWRIRRGGPLPYACAIAAGFLLVTF